MPEVEPEVRRNYGSWGAKCFKSLAEVQSRKYGSSGYTTYRVGAAALPLKAPQAAIEMSRLRAQQQSGAARQSFEQQRQEAQRTQEAQRALATTASTWEADRRRKDPNFDTKYDALMDAVYVLQRREGVPNTPEGVKAQLDKAYKSLAPVQSKPTPQRTPPRQNMSGQVAGNQRPAVRNTMDIIDSVVEA